MAKTVESWWENIVFQVANIFYNGMRKRKCYRIGPSATEKGGKWKDDREKLLALLEAVDDSIPPYNTRKNLIDESIADGDWQEFDQAK